MFKMNSTLAYIPDGFFGRDYASGLSFIVGKLEFFSFKK